MIRAVIVCEGDYADTVELTDNKELDAFTRGFECGAGHYGAGSFGVYTLDDIPTDDPAIDEIIQRHLGGSSDGKEQEKPAG